MTFLRTCTLSDFGLQGIRSWSVLTLIRVMPASVPAALVGVAPIAHMPVGYILIDTGKRRSRARYKLPGERKTQKMNETPFETAVRAVQRWIETEVPDERFAYAGKKLSPAGNRWICTFIISLREAEHTSLKTGEKGEAAVFVRTKELHAIMREGRMASADYNHLTENGFVLMF